MKISRRTTLAILASTVVVAIFVFAWSLCFPGRSFDPALWKIDPRFHPEARFARAEMCDRMIARRTLLQMTRPQIIAMLGEPTPNDLMPNSLMHYELGSERGALGVDSETLVLRLGVDGRVTEVSIHRD